MGGGSERKVRSPAKDDAGGGGAVRNVARARAHWTQAPETKTGVVPLPEGCDVPQAEGMISVRQGRRGRCASSSRGRLPRYTKCIYGEEGRGGQADVASQEGDRLDFRAGGSRVRAEYGSNQDIHTREEKYGTCASGWLSGRRRGKNRRRPRSIGASRQAVSRGFCCTARFESC